VKQVVFSIMLLLILAAQPAHAASITWDGGGADNNWSTAQNWSGDTLPGTADLAIFDGTSTTNATIDAAVDVGGIQIASGYTGTITQATGITLTVGAQHYSQADGVFSGGNSAIDLNGSWTLSGGTFTSTSGTLSVAGSFITSGAPTFNHNSGALIFDSGYAASTSIDANGVVFNSPVVINRNFNNGSNTLTIFAGTTIPLGSDPTFTLNDTGQFGLNLYTYKLINNGTITVAGTTWTSLVDGTFTNNGTISASTITTWTHTGDFINNGVLDTSSLAAFDFNTAAAGTWGSFTSATGSTFSFATNST